MKTRRTVMTLVLFAFSTLVVSGCKKEEKKQVNDPVSQKANNEIKVVNALGPGGKVVQSFFRNWEFKRYKQMCAQTVHSRDERIFIERMKETPVEWRNLTILSENQSGDDWNVEISLEVTSVPCMFAAGMVNLQLSSESDSGRPAFQLTPNFLGIQEFMQIKQTWLLVKLDGEYFIDVCAAGSKKKRHENIMNYVLDASDLDGFPSGPGVSKDDKVTTSICAWLSGVCLDLNIPVEETRDIMVKSKPLFDKAKENLKDLSGKINGLRGKSEDNSDQIESKKDNVNAKHTIDRVETACQFFEKYMLVVRDRQSLKKDAKPLNDGDRANLAEWFTGVDFGKLSKTKKKDCEECRDALVDFLTNPPKSGFSHGYEQAELSKKIFPFLVDFELSGAVATSNGHPDLAEAIDAHFGLAKLLLLMRSKITPDKTEGRPIVKLFGEYFVIYTDLFNAALIDKSRPILAQTALLSMRPDKLTDSEERRLFERMHKSMLQLSNMITEGEDASMESGHLLAIINSLMRELKITPEELERATSKLFADLAKSMLKLSD